MPADLRGRARRVAVPLLIFAASRVVTLAAAHAAKVLRGSGRITDALWRWDGTWYLGVAHDGYPTSVPTGSGNPAQSNLAFFPGYPLAIRAVARVTGVEPSIAGILISMAAGAAAAVVLWAIARRLDGEPEADRGVALWSFFPGAFVLSMVYSEAFFLLFATVCLLALLRQRWIVAGVAGALGAAVRPNGVILAACCLWAAVVAIRARRDWPALAAPALAPIGTVIFFVYLYRRTGDPLAWPHAQARGWGQGIDFGMSALRNAARVVAHPLADFNLLVSTLSLGVLALLAYLLWRWRPPAILLVYSAGIVLPFVLSRTSYFTPRSIVTAFPLVLAGARALRGTALAVVAAASAALMAGLLVLTATTIVFTP